MKLDRIQFPGKTLIISSLDHRYNTFALYFFKLWVERFKEKPGIAFLFHPSDTNPDILGQYSYEQKIPNGFFRQWWFLLQARFRAIVFLNPDHTRDRKLKWAARLAFVKYRAGFAPRRSFHPLSYTIPFNIENHHIVHQFKVFFEYLIGEKIGNWVKPELTSDAQSRDELKPMATSHRVLAIEVEDPLVPHLLPQLIKFINVTTRRENILLLIQSHGAAEEKDSTAQILACQLSDAMTERAIENTQLVINPNMAEKHRIISNAAWVAGVDAEILNTAALMGVPNLSVFGPMNERIWQPFTTRARVLTGEFACRPCSKFPGKVNCTNPVAWQCISGVSSELLSATLTGMTRSLRQMRR